MLSPPVHVTRLRVPDGWISVVRDDLLHGGTKQRAAVPYLRELDVPEVVYASPFSGFAQVALAASAQDLPMEVTLFCEADPAQPGLVAHEFTRLAEAMGARVVLTATLAEAEARAAEYEASGDGRMKIPLGFNDPRFIAHLEKEIVRQLATLEEKPRAIWLPVGSGTLARAFHAATLGRVPLKAVDVRVLEPEDQRITGLEAKVELHRAPERFHERVRLSPPIPSNAYYDAKLWRFLRTHAKEGELWWNVAR